MKKLTRNEYIAVAVGLGVVLLFLPFFFSATRMPTWTAASPVPQASVTEVSNSLLELGVRDVVSGTGLRADVGDTVYVHYVGELENGDVFDTSVTSDEPFRTVLGEGNVILGWDIGLVGMREGGTRHLVVPPDFAYGANAVHDSSGETVVPANATLRFDVVLLKVVKQ